MFFWNSYPFVRLSIVLILGVVCFDQLPELWTYPIWSFCLSLILYSIFLTISERSSFYKLRHLNGIQALLIIFFVGGYLTKVKYHDQKESHYINLSDKISGFSGVIVSPVNERTNHFRYELELTQIVANDSLLPTEGKIHLYVQKDTLQASLRYGDHVNVFGRFYSIPKPGNPGEFNYKQYLARQNIYGQSFVKKRDLEILQNTSLNRILEWAYELRANANAIINKHIPQPRENGIAKALLLGIKDHLDNDLKEAYSAAGAMHVLAVSGLHVGIVFLIIKLIFGRLKEMGKWGKFFFGALSVSVIWLYACVTGLSPSVLRAATMFSLVALSEASVRETNIYNSLGLAAFILLLFDPYLIYSVGFQLSFSAVIGIVYLQPKIHRLLEFRFLILDKAWSITCVSIAAQLATFPLTAYYFHQFPTYFLVSNLIVIPASFLMLSGGLTMLLTDIVSTTISGFVGFLLQKSIWLLNELISYVHILPNSMIEWLYMDRIQLMFTYCIVLTFIVGLHYGAFRTLKVSGFLILLLLVWTLKRNETQFQKHELIFYEIKGKLAIDHIQGHSAKLHIESLKEDEAELLAYQINPYRLSSGLQPINEGIMTLKRANFKKKDVISLGTIGNKKIIILDSTTFHLDFKNSIAIDYVIVNKGAVKSLKWLRDNFSFDMIIIGNNNSIYYSKKMKKQAAKLNLKIHSLKEDGALRILLE